MRRAWMTAFLALVVLGASPAANASPPTWVAPVGPLSAAGQSARDPDVVLDAAGNATAVWARSDGTSTRVEVAVRPAGGSFSEAAPISEPTENGLNAHVAMDAAGDAIAVWASNAGPVHLIKAAYRPAGGTFGAPVPVSSDTESGGSPQVVMDAAGNTVVAWVGSTASTSLMRVALRPAGGSFSAPTAISAAGQFSNQFALRGDGAGNTVVVWPRKASADANAVDARVEAAIRPAGGSFSAPIPASGLHRRLQGVRAALEPDGALQAVYMTYDAPTGTSGRNRIEAARRPAGGAFGTPQDLTATAGATTTTLLPDIAVDHAGNAVAAWMEGFSMWVAARAAGAGAFGAPVRISPQAGDVYGPRVVFDPADDAIIAWPEAWSDDTGNTYLGTFMTTMVRPAGTSSFVDHRKISPDLGRSNGIYAQFAIATNATGDGIAVWEQTDGTKDRAWAAGLDGAPPVISGVSTPTGGVAGSALPFSATAIDTWSPVSLSWAFGDGGTAAEASPSHVYAAPGAFTASFTATDSLGHTASVTRAVPVATAPPGGTTPGGGTDRIAPRLTGASLTPATFRAAPRGAVLAAAAPIGGKLRFGLDEAATVTLSVQRATAGRRVGKTCRRPARSLLKRARCTRYVTVAGKATATAPKGRSTRTFRGRMNNRALAPGRYRLTLVAADAAGNRSTPVRLAFRVVRR